MAAKLDIYEVNINGSRHEFQLTEEDADRMGATKVKPAAKKAATPANKALTPENK